MRKLPFEKERKIFVRKDASTDEKTGCYPERRSVEDLIKYGIIDLNKPGGPTSHVVSDYVKKILNLKKAGHSGTLDPAVSGVLPIALDRATRIVQALLPAGKEYICLMHLHKDAEEKEIRNVMEKFIGKITQLPPVKSAVKRQLRERDVYYLDVIEIKGRDVLFRVGCQAGTYIRRICTDIGKELKMGAHMQQLVRTKAGPFTDKNWITLQDLKDAYEFYKEGSEKEIRNCIMPYETAVEFMPKVWVFDSAVNPICSGAEVYVGGVSKFTEMNPGDTVAIMTLKGELIGLGEAKMETEEIKELKRGVTVKTDSVFMERNTYPKF